MIQGLAAALLVLALEPVPGTPVFSFTDPAITESSGLVTDGPLVVTVNDSGDEARVFTVDPATGDTVGVTRWRGDVQDVEALAPAGEGFVWVGDIGDNNQGRDHVEVTRVPIGAGDRTVEGETFRLTYPDGPHDAESLLADPVTGRLYVAVKDLTGRLYAAPEQLSASGVNQLESVGRVLGFSTDGAFLPDGRHVIVRNYGQAAIFTWPALQRVALLDLPVQQQGEGIAVTDDGDVLLSSEGADAEVLRLTLPDGVLEALAPTNEGPGNLADDDPAADASPWPGWVWPVGGIAVLVVLVALLGRARRP